MTSERDESNRPVPDPLENQAPHTVADVPQSISARPWQSSLFASAPGDGKSIADQADDLLRDGFGR